MANRKHSQMLRESENFEYDAGLPREQSQQLYIRPTLKTFGPVGTLTQSGTMNGVEMTMMNGECSLGQMAMC